MNDGAQIEAVLEEITEKFGDVTILVNNAGITRDTLLMRMKAEDWDAVISTNLTSVFRMSQAVLRPMMKARTGRIINISAWLVTWAMLGKPITPLPKRAWRLYQIAGSRSG